jgi:hypothetical protein
MKRIILLLLLINLFQGGYAQLVHGIVHDKSDNSKIGFASIYINGTSVGTNSDQNGYFELDISKYGSLPLTISALGYYSVTLADFSREKPIEVYLTPKTFELNEVVVRGKKGNWNTYIQIFKKQFLGSSANALRCDILNEKDLRFFNINDTSLSAYSLNPLIINNKALGYNITYYLDKFIYNYQKDEKHIFNETCFILGNYLFKDDLLTLSESEKIAVERRRRNAYFGSRMHFFRLLYLGNLHHRGQNITALSDSVTIPTIFLIYSKNNSKSIVFKKDSISGYIKYKGDLLVKYRSLSSTINIKKDSVYFEKYGFYDPFGVDFTGDMSKRRIGDLLPYEYKLK